MGNSKIPAGSGGCHHPHPQGANVYVPPVSRVDYDNLEDKPTLNGVTIQGNLSAADYGLFDADYDSLTDKPMINGVTLEGDISAEELGLIYYYADDADIDSLFQS